MTKSDRMSIRDNLSLLAPTAFLLVGKTSGEFVRPHSASQKRTRTCKKLWCFFVGGYHYVKEIKFWSP